MSKLRKKIIAGNWKMNKTLADACELAEAITQNIPERLDVDVVLCPPFTALKAVGDVIDHTNIKLGAQNMHWMPDGAYTGEISAGMLRDIYCHFVILGHSERRTYFGETDEIVNRKVTAALAAHLTPIVCVGETLEERDGGNAFAVVQRQLKGSLDGLGAGLAKIVVAYEPVWAIGTGRTAEPCDAQEMHAYIRGVLAELGGDAVAQSIRIQYGGSMKPSNAAKLLAQPDIDGGLIGGAALDARAFIDIVNAPLAV